MLADLLSPTTSAFAWDEQRVRVSDGKPMRSYQLRAAYKIFEGEPTIDVMTGKKIGLDRDGTAVHIDPGLGKTVTALTAIVEWVKTGLVTPQRPVLVVAPIKVCETVWRQEAREWTHTRHLTFELIRGDEKRRAFAQKRPAHIHLINPELLPWLQKYIRADWAASYSALIIDESSMFKDHRAQRFRVLSNYGTAYSSKDRMGNRGGAH
jgi:SNF2 family DNA or RNA helicase